MRFRCIAALVCAYLFSPGSSFAQHPPAAPNGIVRRIEFQGLQRIPPSTLRARISSREGQPLDPSRIEADVRALDALGWFESIRTEAEPMAMLLASTAPEQMELPLGPSIRLTFVLEERPFLAKVEFRGSRQLPRERIESLLAQRAIRLKIAAPANPTEFFHARRALETALADLGYPHAHVRLELRPVPRAAVRAVFHMEDGPRVHVAEVRFEGNRAFAEKTLERQMKRVAPEAVFAGPRGKTIYTPDRLAEDLDRLARFYRDHGYPEAQLGEPRVESRVEPRRRWLPWPRRAPAETLHLAIPVTEGPRIQVESVTLDGAAPGVRAQMEPLLREVKVQAPYSDAKLLEVQERLEQLARRTQKGAPARAEVDVTPEFNRDAGTARITFRVRDAEPYTVRRIEFQGHHRFTDRYYRRRVLLAEGDALDSTKLERGLQQLARAGFIRPATRDDIRVHLNPDSHTADVTIHVEEIGRQRVSLVGGAGSLGNTLGLAYTVFDLLGGEEFITTHFEGGPANLQVLLGIAKEGLFGTRASLGLNVFHNVVRPNLPGAAGRERLFTTRNSGLSLAAGYPLTARDSLGLTYERARDSSRLHGPVPPGIPADALETRNARRAVGLVWSRDAGPETLNANASVSGGWLGGDERLVRSSLEYARLQADPLSHSRNTWAWRGFVAGVSSYDGRPLALHQRLFGGDQLLRGLRTGELAPYVVTETKGPDGSSQQGAQSGGANLVASANAEYRVPFEAGSQKMEAVAFFDAGTGWLLPQWLGAGKPRVVSGTNGILRASTGLELRFQLPMIHQTARVHYAVSPLRLAQAFLPNGAPFRPPDRRSAFGWALGSFF